MIKRVVVYTYKFNLKYNSTRETNLDAIPDSRAGPNAPLNTKAPITMAKSNFWTVGSMFNTIRNITRYNVRKQEAHPFLTAHFLGPSLQAD